LIEWLLLSLLKFSKGEVLSMSLVVATDLERKASPSREDERDVCSSDCLLLSYSDTISESSTGSLTLRRPSLRQTESLMPKRMKPDANIGIHVLTRASTN